MPRSGSISAHCRRPRSPSRSWRRSPPPCAPTGSRGARRRDAGGMIFDEIAVSEAEGAILAHSVKLPGRALRKGRVLSADDVAALLDSGLAKVTAARLAEDELGEDEAASRLAG